MIYFFLSVLSGLLLYFGWPPYGNPICLFIALFPLLYVEEYFSGFIFKYSFVTFFIWNLLTTWWLHYSKKIDGTFAIFEAYLVPTIFNALFMSITFTIYSIIKKKYINNIKTNLIILICIWILFEKIHLEWDLSWPWLNLGNGFANRIHWIQWYEYTGALGGTLWIWITNTYIFYTYLKYKKDRNILFFVKRIIILILIILFIITLSELLYISYRHNTYNNRKCINFIILQPNIDPYLQKYNLSNKQIISKVKNLLNNKISKKIDSVIIAPETMFLDNEKKNLIENIENNYIVSTIRNYLRNKSSHSIFITGIELSNNNKNYFNSAIKIKDKLNSVQIHHKSKLVPVVEFFPYKKIIYPIFGNILINFGEKNLINLDKQKFIENFYDVNLKICIAPIICYESVFGEYVSRFFKKNANMMIIMTNDGWWGKSKGHIQHMYYSRLRAIENRKYIARSANTGISCCINDKGEFISLINYGKTGVLNCKLFINNKKTFYTKHGDLLVILSYFILFIIFLYFFLKKLKSLKYYLNIFKCFR